MVAKKQAVHEWRDVCNSCTGPHRGQAMQCTGDGGFFSLVFAAQGESRGKLGVRGKGGEGRGWVTVARMQMDQTLEQCYTQT